MALHSFSLISAEVQYLLASLSACWLQSAESEKTLQYGFSLGVDSAFTSVRESRFVVPSEKTTSKQPQQSTNAAATTITLLPNGRFDFPVSEKRQAIVIFLYTTAKVSNCVFKLLDLP